ncbi:MAG: formate acetyltransferase [Chloroflexi bacterium]|nr:formate acetyltransferase [Chloroflexota bacterium]
MVKRTSTDFLARVLLLLMAANYNLRPSLRKYLKSSHGWLNFSIGVRTETNTVEKALIFNDGKARVSSSIPKNVDATLIFAGDEVVKEMLKVTPNEVLNMLLKSRLRIEGNMNYVQLFNFLMSLLLWKKHKKMVEKQKAEDAREKAALPPSAPILHQEMSRRRKERLVGKKVDAGVKYLSEPYLSQYDINDFPRLKKFLDIHFETKPEICHERAKLVTDWCVANGFEVDKSGKTWVPELRQGDMFRYLMENKEPVIRKDDLIAGTTTTKEIGVILYPDAHANMIWGELLSTPDRQLNPYDISPETVEILHHYVFPYWMKRNFREWVREKYNRPLSQMLDERFAVYFLWKTVAMSHTIPNFPKLLALGTKGIIREIKEELKRDKSADTQKKHTLEAMILCLQGLAAYARNLSKQAAAEVKLESDAERKAELERLAAICARVPENPAETLDEAINAMWIAWIGLHTENTNAGLSLGRLDQWLQPYFVTDMKKLATEKEREEYIKKAIELVGCLYMRCADHLPLVPDIGNYLFGGSSSDQVITLGGVTPAGEDAVCDMTYIFLKVTEMLGIRDPNVNARYNRAKNSDTYLKRLCEVNMVTAATPSMHNDEVVMKSLESFNYPVEDLRDWSATGCVEPTLCGKHMGHTNCMMMNMVAALEMALNNGKHPLMNWEVGPRTGSIEDGAFKTFEGFFDAFKTQFKFLIDKSVEYNNMLGEAHGVLRPTPLLSALIDGPIKKGKDITKGGAKHNSSGSACIGLADVTDSLMVIKRLVFDEKKVTFKELKRAIDNNFADNSVLHAMVTKKVPFFGSDNGEAVDIANRVTEFARDTYWNHVNYRGGRYTAGFWSMSNHVAFGTLSGALPSGRLAGKAFTPGLTPEPNASKNLLENIRDVARLNPRNMNNNIAFNIKVVPSARDTREEVVNSMFSYAKTYFELGGMQMQMNVVTSAMLRDAMAHPENYRNLLVRISGYNAYFVTLNKDMQVELIERAEYGI